MYLLYSLSNIVCGGETNYAMATLRLFLTGASDSPHCFPARMSNGGTRCRFSTR